jgi:MHS family proline/betaine transporter-like MFS transporter
MSTRDVRAERLSPRQGHRGQQGQQVTNTTRPGSRTIAAAAIGNLLEAYDFAVYGYFAVIISPLFFPSSNPTASLLLTVATFGVGFLMRPAGAVVLGALADRKGRKLTLSLTILMMAGGTALIGLAPTYAVAGVWAPAIIVLARLIQGFSAGGEVGTATAFLVEHAAPHRKGFFASWQQTGQAIALLAGSSLAGALTATLSAESLASWGWRVPFLLGILIGPVGFYIRARTDEPADYRAAADRASHGPLGLALRRYRRAILTGFGITITWTVCTYFFLVYLPTYAIRELKVSQSGSFLATSLSLLVLVGLAPVFGALSDRLGRRWLLLGSGASVVVLTYPALELLTRSPGFPSLLAFQLGFAVLIAAFTGVAPAAMAEVCPPEVRSTSVSISYSFAVAIFGGFAPFVATWLIGRTGSSLAPAWYVVAACALSWVLVFLLYKGIARSCLPNSGG